MPMAPSYRLHECGARGSFARVGLRPHLTLLNFVMGSKRRTASLCRQDSRIRTHATSLFNKRGCELCVCVDIPLVLGAIITMFYDAVTERSKACGHGPKGPIVYIMAYASQFGRVLRRASDRWVRHPPVWLRPEARQGPSYAR